MTKDFCFGAEISMVWLAAIPVILVAWGIIKLSELILAIKRTPATIK